MAKTNINVRVEVALRARVELIGEHLGLSLPDTTRLALTQFLAEWERENAPLPRGDVERRIQRILDNAPSIRLKKGR